MLSRLLLAGLVCLLIWGYKTAQVGKRRYARERARSRGRSGGVSEGAGKEAAPRSPYDVLGVERGAGQQEIRRAYLERIRQYHPDKVASAAPEIQRLAEARTAELNAAYDALSRG